MSLSFLSCGMLCADFLLTVCYDISETWYYWVSWMKSNFTACQLSCKKVLFLVMSICPYGGEVPMWSLSTRKPHSQPHPQNTGTPPVPAFQTCLDLFTWTSRCRDLALDSWPLFERPSFYTVSGLKNYPNYLCTFILWPQEFYQYLKITILWGIFRLEKIFKFKVFHCYYFQRDIRNLPKSAISQSSTLSEPDTVT